MGRVSDAKQRILDATIELVWRSSYGAVTLDAVCQRAGVRKGSLYYFFKSKAELVATALEHQWERTEPDLARLFAPSVPPLQSSRTTSPSAMRSRRTSPSKRGRVLGCPYMSIGCEVNREEALVCTKAQELIQRHIRYLETGHPGSDGARRAARR
jgi:TetR/AcrR family transcriptional repressor of nem operon